MRYITNGKKSHAFPTNVLWFCIDSSRIKEVRSALRHNVGYRRCTISTPKQVSTFPTIQVSGLRSVFQWNQRHCTNANPWGSVQQVYGYRRVRTTQPTPSSHWSTPPIAARILKPRRQHVGFLLITNKVKIAILSPNMLSEQ